MRSIRLVVSALFIAAAALSSAPSLAASSIRVKVDDQPITSYDIAQRAKLLQITGVPGGEKAATEELIDETIQFIEAAKNGVGVSDARVNAAIDDIATRVKMTTAQLTKALAGEGVDIDTLRRRIKAQMIWGQLVQMRTRLRGGSVKGSDVTAAMFAEAGSDDVKTMEYTLKPIIFIVPKGAPAGLSDQRRREAEAFRGRFGGCDAAAQQASQLKGVVVRSTMRRSSEELQGAPELKDIQETAPGGLTRPRKTEEGYLLLAVCTAKSIQSNAAARLQTENKLLDELNKDLGKEYMAELRKKAVIEYR